MVVTSGCASQIMQGYVGKTLQEAMLDSGTPANAFDMPDGSRAFQWIMNSTFVTPTTAMQTGTVTGVGNMALWSSQTQIVGGQAISSSCAYTMLAKWDVSRNAWILTDYREPKPLV